MFSFYRLVEELEREEILNEEINPINILQYILAFLTLVLTILVIYLSSKTSPKLSKIIQEVTGESKWKVKILKSEVPNALAIALGTHTVFVTKGLMKIMTEREVIAVMLHEVKHLRSLDSLQNMAASVGAPIFLFALSHKYRNDAIRNNDVNALNLSLVLALLGLVTLLFLSVFVKITLGRWNETKADAYSIKYGYGKDMASALVKLGEWDKKEQAKHECGLICRLNRKVSDVFDEHPQIKLRIERILQKEEVQKALISKDPSIIRKVITSLKLSKEI